MAIVPAIPMDVMEGMVPPDGTEPVGGGYGTPPSPPSTLTDYAASISGSREYRSGRAVPIDEVADPKVRLVTPMMTKYNADRGDSI